MKEIFIEFTAILSFLIKIVRFEMLFVYFITMFVASINCEMSEKECTSLWTSYTENPAATSIFKTQVTHAYLKNCAEQYKDAYWNDEYLYDLKRPHWVASTPKEISENYQQKMVDIQKD
jgi:hypothetical protein